MAEGADFPTACEQADLETIARLFEDHGKSCTRDEGWDEDLQRGLYRAAYDGRTEVVEFLLSHGVEASDTIAMAATRHLPVFQMLVKHGFDMNSTEVKVAPSPLRQVNGRAILFV
ncbi:hypothetical protein CONLIGDRAFT_642363 [Coniochaeta ligniaria NRRL 30616]|uniref:Ankyrin n=1 Tax=Coniochaeta ligniaria NRRL 30616 TaxID=1408157 RepID=A0A1J7JH26_9PEZI|nr:hypothetical protein CONLIGDRAFT_642363 [Coniochaeta ligniaria NRRL 30616]